MLAFSSSHPLRARHVFRGVFGVLVVALFSTLNDPFYWDNAIGFMHEAVWLEKHGFDGLTLAGLPWEMGYGLGGPKVYIYSIYPYFQGLLLRLLGPGFAFILVNHLLHLAAASLLVTAVWLLLRRVADETGAAIGSGLLMIQPLFITQAGIVNMDVPMYALAYTGMYLVITHRYGRAGLLLTLAGLVKTSAAYFSMLGCIAMAMTCRKPRDLLWLPWLAGAFVYQRVTMRSFSTGAVQMAGDGGMQYMSWLFEPWRYRQSLGMLFERVPDLVVLFAVSGIGTLIWLGCRLKGGEPWSWRGTWTRRDAFRMPLICLGGLVLMGLMVPSVKLFLPRYLLLAMPLACIGLVGGLHALGRRGLPLKLVCGAAAVLAVSQWHGAWARGLSPEYTRNNGHILERSLEYRRDLALQERLARLVRERFPDRIIVTSWPQVHALTLPGLGYVRTPAKVMASHRPVLHWNGVEQYWARQEDLRRTHRPEDIVWVWQDNVFSTPPLKFEESDVVERVRVGDREAVIVRFKDWPDP